VALVVFRIVQRLYWTLHDNPAGSRSPLFAGGP
jgi:hypothetical protein